MPDLLIQINGSRSKPTASRLFTKPLRMRSWENYVFLEGH